MTIDTDLTAETSQAAGETLAGYEAERADAPVTIIAPTNGWRALDLRELWRYRELAYFLAWRDVKVRYKQTVIGAAWVVVQPFLTMVIFSVIFGRIARIPSEGVPYPIFAYAGLLPWTFFSTALNQGGTSLVGNANMIQKIYFPRIIMPLAAVLAALVDFAVAFVVLLGMMLYYGVTPTRGVLLLPLFVLLAVVTALGVGVWLAAVNVKYRDVRYTLAFMTQVWLFLTPVAYPSSMIPSSWRLIYGLNPMAGVVEGFRWALLGTENAPGGLILVSATMVVALLVGGLFYFRRMEREFADVI